ncbi:MAG: 2-oxoglutarate oxidoreductase subunit KorA [Legionellaceae bacterium]
METMIHKINDEETPIKELNTVIIRFAGDSGDGMQLTGSQFTSTSANLGNDVHTFPDFPAEIRAPAGTLLGVSGFQLSFSQQDIHTPGDLLDVLVAMNPAALKVNILDLITGGILILNEDGFEDKDLKKAKYTANPLETGELSAYQTICIPMTTLTINAIKHYGLSHSQSRKCKNMFALGVVFWLYTRPLEYTITWIEDKFKKNPVLAQANIAALRAGFNFALTTELFAERYTVKKAKLPKGTYRQITGNEALGFGCAVAAVKSERTLLLSGYPITPASAILHQVSKYTHFGVKTFQAEDEIAAICSSIGAAFGGSLAITSTSGPGLDLKSEGLGLAVMAELPLVVINVQRAGPSTGMPTKTEQADLLTAMYGRHGECPLPILAPATPGDSFYIVLEAFRIALKYMTPVIILSDGYLANGAEPWKLPELEDLPNLKPHFHTDATNFTPYTRDPITLARLWAIPGTPGLEHRLGGLEKNKITGDISYDPDNHQEMIMTRATKVKQIAQDIQPAELIGNDKGRVLIISWGGTYGTVLSAVEALQEAGQSVSMLHLRHLNPFPSNLSSILTSFDKIIVAELNAGQLSKLIQAEFLIQVIPFNKVTGKPFLISEIRDKLIELL